ncbi:putative 45.4 kDa protein in thiaminase I 5'region [Actinoplanes friuliensis DSM 7358]|uniref:Putative 45.4 kDa protein in thiaminase I 5'region n=1 Tax=Actinoplanes friuliensis DSM 7358 TaxID=1246995 RepID=U5VRH1_9ACTN|nr:putative 45.4 kDa protein in thiaminase I 5'region [Actinoplanes friuliensis DSM 7358]
MLYDNAVATLTAWQATSDEADLARKRTLELLTAGPAAMTRAHRPGHVTASTLIVDDQRRVLLCLHGRLGMWMQLGGHCEPTDETLTSAALREATEESGIPGLRLDPDPIDVDIHAVRCGAAPGEPATESLHYDVRFLAVCPPGAIESISEESTALAWFTPDALPSPLAAGVTQQLAPAFARL